MGENQGERFGDRLHRLRQAAGLTQEALAERAHVSLRAISDLERGQRSRPWPSTVRLLADALELGPTERAALEGTARRALPPAAARAPEPDHPKTAARHNLPMELTSFIGRQPELAEAKERLASSRLLTLAGSGGCGKTRLAWRVAAEVLHAYPDGVWLVELAPLGDPMLVPQAVALALGVREVPGRPLLATLADYLGGRTILLVLDNCEHLLAACAHLANALLRACPRLRLLATSRERLGIDGEVVWQVPSLTLPAPLASFVGRQREIVAAKRLLATTRLVTLTGPPGVGKTRLAQEIAAGLAGDFADGTWFVDLAPLGEPGQVAPAIAGALGLRDVPDPSVLDAAKAYLRDRRALLALDNFEHVVAAAPLVAELLAAAPGLTVLATSRERLRLRGEHALVVPPLALPDLADAPPAAERLARIEAADAVRLFVARAREVDATFAPTEEDTVAVAAICARLDGLPLAIELAAAHVRLFPPRALLARLSRRLPLLTSAPQDQPAHQRTLRATLDWSFALLAADERAVLRRLAVFVGGCTLEAAGAVCASAGVAPDDVPDVVARLVEKSLAVAERSGDTARVRLLETVREYADERLVAAGESASAHDRHLDWFVTFAEQAEVGLRGRAQDAWARRLEAERDNLRAALAWSVEGAGRTALALRLVGALAQWWGRLGDPVEGKAWLGRTLAGPCEVGPAIRAKALGPGAWLAFRHGDFPLAATLANELLALSRERGDPQGRVAALRTLAVCGGEQVGDALEWERACLDLCRELGDCWETAYELFAFAVGCNFRGEPARARSYLERSLAIFQKLGDHWSATRALAELGVAARGMGDDRTAEALLTESLGGFRTWGRRGDAGFCLAGLADLARGRGDLPLARARLVEALQEFEEAGALPGVARLVHRLAGLAVVEGRPERGVRLFGATEALRARLGMRILPAERTDYDADVAAARRLLDDVAFAQLWAQGRTMTVEQAIAEATEPPARPPGTPVVSPGPPAAGCRALSSRECQVASLIAAGLTNRQIAARLGVAERTADSHVSHLLAKLGLARRSQIAVWAATGGERPSPTPEGTSDRPVRARRRSA